MKKMIVALLTIAALAAGGWFYFYGPCGTRTVAAAVGELQGLERQWSDVIVVVENTPRFALGEQISRLQSIQRETEELEVPGCLERGRGLLLEMMVPVTEAAIAFMGGNKAPIPELLPDELRHNRLDFRSELAFVQRCAPFCQFSP